ncbi:MAG: DUF1385 domain-containing protein [Desulfovibrio sp.]|nr:DUF1385 domain-containing protein [Desulfovibrio sp.]
MLRDGARCGLAVRLPDGSIYGERSAWISFSGAGFLSWPFVRGFPILLETLINGVRAFNRSIVLAEGAAGDGSGAWRTAVSIALAILVAAVLFIFAPHLLSSAMHFINLGGDVDGASFHLWDGFFKCAIFMAYIYFIGFFPEIRRIYEYHGAEHKIIQAWESGENVSARGARRGSRLHPRCGTTFALVVICVAIILQSFLIPLFLKFWTPRDPVAKHLLTIALKLVFIAPISACAYEIIRLGANLPAGRLSFLLQAPGLATQRLTTREPDACQLEVAVVALNEAVGGGDDYDVSPAPYSREFKPVITEK